MNNKHYTVYGPEGIPLSPEPFKTIEEAFAAYNRFLTALASQGGYYFDCDQQRQPMEWVLANSTIASEDEVPGDWEQVGVVGVDSGQLMVCDPCYVESEWQDEDEAPPKKATGHKHRTDDRVWYCSMHGKAPTEDARAFQRFDDVIARYGKSMNEMIADGDMEEIPNEPSGVFSYAGCCEATLSKKGFGQLDYQLGHEGAGCVWRSGFGDGAYDVYAKTTDTGDFGERISEVLIRMITPADLEDEEEEDEV